MSFRCRVCLEFFNNGSYLHEDIDGWTYAEMIKFWAGIQIHKDDGLPSCICATCGEDCKRAFAFFRKCRISDKELRREYLHHKKTKRIVPERVEQPNARTLELEIELLPNPADVPEQQQPIETVEGYAELKDEPKLYAENDSASEYMDDDDYDSDAESVHRFGFIGDCAITEYFCCYNDCTTSSFSKDELKNHILAKHPTEQQDNVSPNQEHRCDVCDRTFSTATEQSLHVRLRQFKEIIVHGSPETESVPFHVLVRKEKICCDCYASFPTVEALVKHTFEQHGHRSTVKDSYRRWRCEVCFMRFHYINDLREHIHEPYFEFHLCNTCEIYFDTGKQVEAHRNTHRPKAQFLCEKCGDYFKDNQKLQQHRLLHEDTQEVCKTCGKRFLRKSNFPLQEPVKTLSIFTACPHCSKQFRYRSLLKQHLKVHLPKKCQDCEKKHAAKGSKAAKKKGTK